jgi:hypothetical protein
MTDTDKNILYISITYGDPLTNYWQVPEDLSKFEALDFIRSSPKSLLQLSDIDTYNEMQLSKIITMQDVFFLSFNNFVKQFPQLRGFDKERKIVVLIDMSFSKSSKVIKCIKINSDNTFVFAYNFTDEICKVNLDGVTVVSSSKNLINALSETKLSASSLQNVTNSQVGFGPTRSLFAVTNQAVLNYWTGDFTEVSYDEAVSMSRNALEGKDKNKREDLYMQKLDEYTDVLYKIAEKSKVNTKLDFDFFPSLILVYPFHSPVVKDQMKESKFAIHKTYGISDRQFTRILQAEQDEQYLLHTYMPDGNDNSRTHSIY